MSCTQKIVPAVMGLRCFVNRNLWFCMYFFLSPGLFPAAGRRRSSQRGAGHGNIVVVAPFTGSGRGRAQIPTRRGTPQFIVLGGVGRRPTATASRTSRQRAPPGVQFIGTSGSTGGNLGNLGGQISGGNMPIVSFLPPAITQHAPPPVASQSGGVLFVDGRNVGNVADYGGLAGLAGLGGTVGGGGHGGPIAVTPPGQTFTLNSAAVGANIPGVSNKLTIQGQSATGDLILNGPGGTITIGAEVLNGIAMAGRGLRMTEFEEMEVEPEPGMGRANNASALRLTSKSGQSIVLHGKQTMLPGPMIGTSAGSHVGGALAPNGPMVLGGLGAGASSSSSSSASASASAGTAKASASASASANSIVLDSKANNNNIAGGGVGGGAASGASSSASSGTILVRSGSGKNERVLQLGQTDGKSQVITLGGGGQGIQVGQGGQGIQVPGNATIVIGG